MKKKDFITLVIGVIGTLLFGVGMCCCLLPEWNAFNTGVILAIIGGLMLLILGCIGLKKNAKGKRVNWKLIGKIAYSTISALVLGVGMCLIMVWNMMLIGILIGIIGIVMLLVLIPMFVGFKDDKEATEEK